MNTRLANVKSFAQVAVTTAAMTAVGLGFGPAIAQGAPHLFPHPDVETPAGDQHPIRDEFKGIIYFRQGIPIGSILRGQENVSHIIETLVTCRPHERNSQRSPDGFIFVHC